MKKAYQRQLVFIQVYIQVEFEFGNIGFCGAWKTLPGKPLGGKLGEKQRDVNTCHILCASICEFFLHSTFPKCFYVYEICSNSSSVFQKLSTPSLILSMVMSTFHFWECTQHILVHTIQTKYPRVCLSILLYRYFGMVISKQSWSR